MAATNYGTGIYTSSNYGNTWSKTLATDGNSNQWEPINFDSSGRYLVAGIWGGGIYYSSNSGSSWLRSNAPNFNWCSIASSQSGSYLSAGVCGGGMYYSSNFGATWTASDAPSICWAGITSSSSGRLLAAVGEANGLYLTTSYRASWYISKAFNTIKWVGVAMDSSGGMIYATSDGKGIYKSTPTFSPTAPPTITACLEGQYSLSEVSCSKCAPGKYSNAIGASSESTCVSCEPGKYATLAGSSSCALCPVGKVSQATGASSPSTCVDCVAGLYNNVEGRSSCSSCPRDTISYSGQAYCVNCPYGSSTSSTSSSYCDLESDHPYLNNGDVVTSPMFYLSGVSKYVLTFDTSTSITTCTNSCDSLTVSTPGPNAVEFHKYASSDDSNPFQVATTEGFVMKLKTDSIYSINDWGYRVRITPVKPDFDSISDTKVSVSFVVVGLLSSDFEGNSAFQAIFIDALLLAAYNKQHGLSIIFSQASSSSSPSSSSSSSNASPSLSSLQAFSFSNLRRRAIDKVPHSSRDFHLSETGTRLSFTMTVPSIGKATALSNTMCLLLHESFTSGRLMTNLNSQLQRNSDTSINAYSNSIVIDSTSGICSIQAGSISSDDNQPSPSLEYLWSLLAIPVVVGILYLYRDELQTISKGKGNKVAPFEPITPELNHQSSVNRFGWSSIKIHSTSAKEALLGKGGFASVCRGSLVQKSGQFEVAIKIFTESDDRNYNELCSKAEKEAATMAGIEEKVFNKDVIVSLYGVVSGPLTPEITKIFRIPDGEQRVGLLMRLEAGGDLDSLLHPKAENSLSNHLNLEFKLGLIKNIANGLRELHGVGFVHGDMKPQNILLFDRKIPNTRLSDFSLSEFVDIEKDADMSTFRNTKTMKGTLAYNAPELLAHKSNNFIVTKPSRRTDMYAFGIIMWEVMTGLYPYGDVVKNEHLLIENVHSDDANVNRPLISRLPIGTPPILRFMIVSCLDKDRSVRMNAVECYSTITHALNIESKKSFDIFLSHAWVDKGVCAHVMALLTDLGYRVWYDISNMGNNIEASMVAGIANSTVVLACLDSIYQGKDNCMYELREAAKYPNKIVGLLLERIDFPLPPKVWTTTNTLILQEVHDIMKFKTQMFCDISKVAQNPLWNKKEKVVLPNGCVIQEEEDQFTSVMLSELKKAIQPLVTILDNAGCKPSMRK